MNGATAAAITPERSQNAPQAVARPILGIPNATPPTAPSRTGREAPSAQVPPERAPLPRPPFPGYEELPPSIKFRRQWRAVLIPRDTTLSELIALAHHLHHQTPESPVRFFNDSDQYEAFRLHDENYPSREYPSPEAWTSRHYVALLNFVPRILGSRWELWAMDAGYRYTGREKLAIIE